jgi:SAM-dependent methyltransferase
MQICKLPYVKKILDIGSGPCLLAELYPYIDSEITFVDKDDSDGSEFQRAIQKMKSCKRFKFVETTSDDLSMLESNAYEMVTFLNVIEHLTPEQIEKTMCEIKRVLEPNGILVLVTPNKKGRQLVGKYLTHPGHIEEFTFEEIEAMLDKSDFIRLNKEAGIIRIEKLPDNNVKVDCMVHAENDLSYLIWTISENMK